jgi:GT2 family glycosyltransferase
MKNIPKLHTDADLSQVCVVTVTYNDRRHLLYQTLEAVQRYNVPYIVVVLNGVPEEVRSDIVERFKDSGSSVQFVICDENLGSAGGFAAGLKHACTLKNVRFAWLLDDDNVPQGAHYAT